MAALGGPWVPTVNTYFSQRTFLNQFLSSLPAYGAQGVDMNALPVAMLAPATVGMQPPATPLKQPVPSSTQGEFMIS